MRNHPWGTIRGLAVAIVALAATGAGRSAEAPEPCCFTNDQFAGVCRVVPAPDETCAGILGYLNNPASSGKAYCDSTTIRGGWVRAKCESEAQHQGTPAAPRTDRIR